VQDYEADGIAGICFEDNIFPKRCSFYAGVKRELVSAEEHAGKVRAAIDARRSDDFVIIARTEAYIAGWGLDEARKRADAYADAGADMVLVHSKSKDFTELKRFAEQWDRPTPLVAVPTIYSHVTADELDDAGFKLVIFANHALRSSLKAMRECLDVLKTHRKTESVEHLVVPLTDVYEVIGVPQMKENEQTYMPKGADTVTAVVLAAGASEALGELTQDKPKCMLEVRGKSLLEHQVATLNATGVKEIAVVRGYQKQAVDVPGLRYYDNDAWAEGGEVDSLLKAKPELGGRTVILFGDILFDEGVLEKALKSEADVTMVVDRAWTDQQGDLPGKPDLVTLADSGSDNKTRFLGAGAEPVLKTGSKLGSEAHAEFIGMLVLSPEGTQRLKDLYGQLVESAPSGAFHEAESFQRAALTDLLQEMINRGDSVSAVSIYKGWSEVDTFDDYRRAWAKK
jgi:phosphoenolpyruvate phosphomutase